MNSGYAHEPCRPFQYIIKMGKKIYGFDFRFSCLGALFLAVSIVFLCSMVSVECSLSTDINPNKYSLISAWQKDDSLNKTGIVLINPPSAYIVYGDDGYEKPKYKGILENGFLISNPDFRFPLIGEESFTLKPGDSFGTSRTWLVSNQTADVVNFATITPILKQDRNGNIEKVGKSTGLRISHGDNIDNFHIESGTEYKHYILDLFKVMNHNITSIYETRLIVGEY